MQRTIALATGIDMAIDDVGDGPPVIMIHGFPETRYSWRHQLPALAAAGYRAIAIDCRGYGGSSKPDEVDAYSLEKVVADLIALVATETDHAPVLVGHDWGSIVMWTAAVTHPTEWRALASLNVPYRGWCTAFPTIDFIRDNLMDRFSYVVRFQEEGLVEGEFAADPGSWLRAIYSRLAGRPDFLADDEFAAFERAFTAGGIRGPLNYYRNIDANHHALARFHNARIDLPSLMISADADPVLPRSLVDGMERWIPNLVVAPISDAGHWVQQEQPAAVNDALLEFLESLPEAG